MKGTKVEESINKKEYIMTTRRKFLTTASIGGAAALATPAIVQAQSTIKWRFQTYAGGALGEHVTKPVIDYINANSAGRVVLRRSNSSNW